MTRREERNVFGQRGVMIRDFSVALGTTGMVGNTTLINCMLYECNLRGPNPYFSLAPYFCSSDAVSEPLPTRLSHALADP